MENVADSIRLSAFRFLEGDRESTRCRAFQSFIVALIVLNGVAVILESNQSIHGAYSRQFYAFEIFSVIIFTVEYLSRVWACTENDRFSGLPGWRARLSYIFSPMALIDLLAIAPFYLSLFIAIDLRYLRFFRLLRLLKLSHYFDGLKIFSEVIKGEASAISSALLTMLILIIVSACLMFSVEAAAQPDHFDSIIEAIWWAVVTLTTVGYGDITPITFAGKLLAIAIMLLGIGTMALPAGILAARFSEELQIRREYLRAEVAEMFSDGVLDADERAAIDSMQRKLGVSRSVLERLLAEHRQAAKRCNYCPNCGEKLC
ncbi:MAG: ion transporter [Halioglobus sp.]|nr:ion transporter [Halioglobus sp.]